MGQLYLSYYLLSSSGLIPTHLKHSLKEIEVDYNIYREVQKTILLEYHFWNHRPIKYILFFETDWLNPLVKICKKEINIKIIIFFGPVDYLLDIGVLKYSVMKIKMYLSVITLVSTNKNTDKMEDKNDFFITKAINNIDIQCVQKVRNKFII